MAKAQQVSKWFSYRDISVIWKLHSAAVPVSKITLKTDISHSSIAARYYYIHSLLRLKKGLEAYCGHDSCPAQFKQLSLTATEWVQLSEIEAVIRIIHNATTLVRTDTEHIGTFKYMIQQQLLSDLRCKELEVIDLSNLDAENPNPNRFLKRVENFTDLGRECIKRAKLECERRFCGNKGSTTNCLAGRDIIIDEDTEISLMLDPRCLGQLAHWNGRKKADVCLRLKAEYIKFCLEHTIKSSKKSSKGTCASDGTTVNAAFWESMDQEDQCKKLLSKEFDVAHVLWVTASYQLEAD